MLAARRSTTDMLQTGLYDISDSAVDITAPAPLPQEARPPKRRFTEIDDSDDEGPNSDELYGWVEDDLVAAEGLLIDETGPTQETDATAAEDSAPSRTDRAPDDQRMYVSQKRTASKETPPGIGGVL